MTDQDVPPGRLLRLLQYAVPVQARELAAVLWSFAYFFCLLGGYYILRPVRDEMGIQGGVEQLQWLFTGTFIAMLVAVPLFAWVASRFPRRTFVPAVYYFFIANILIFYGLFQLDIAETTLARAFFIWTSVFNLFVISVFWSFMADIFTSAQAKRLFAFIAAGGSTGAIAGPATTGLLAPAIGPVNLLPVAAAVLSLALIAIHKLRHWDVAAGHGQGRSNAPTEPDRVSTERPVGGGVLTGIQRVFANPYLIGICGFILLYTTLATFLYFQQAHIVEDAFADSGQRTAVFAGIDFAVNSLTILFQVFLTHRIVGRFGLAATLAILPVVMMAGFASLGLAPVLAILVGFQVLRRAGNYAIARPAREMLFTVVDREEKYKSKNFIDTVVYRGGDALAGWVFAGLLALGLGLSGIAFVAIPVAAAWLAVGVWLGRRHERLHQDRVGAPSPAPARQRGD